MSHRLVNNTYLAEVEEVLEDGHFPQLEAVCDGVAHDEGGDQVLHGPGLAAVWPEVEGVEAAGEVVREWGAGVVQEQRVVRQRRHRDTWVIIQLIQRVIQEDEPSSC